MYRERSVVIRINPEEEGCRHWPEECSPPMGQVPAPLARPPRSQYAAILVREAKGPKDQGTKHRLSFYDESAVVVAPKVVFAAVVTAA
jgi:hypothetical protein